MEARIAQTETAQSHHEYLRLLVCPLNYAFFLNGLLPVFPCVIYTLLQCLCGLSKSQEG